MSELLSLTMNAGRLRAVVTNPPALIEETEYGCAVTTLGGELSQDDVKPLAAAMAAARAAWNEEAAAIPALTLPSNDAASPPCTSSPS